MSRTNNHHKKVVPATPFCGHCKNLGLPASVFESHFPHTTVGRQRILTCEQLKNTECPNCLKKGHTLKHCTAREGLHRASVCYSRSTSYASSASSASKKQEQEQKGPTNRFDILTNDDDDVERPSKKVKREKWEAPAPAPAPAPASKKQMEQSKQMEQPEQKIATKSWASIAASTYQYAFDPPKRKVASAPSASKKQEQADESYSYGYASAKLASLKKAAPAIHLKVTRRCWADLEDDEEDEEEQRDYSWDDGEQPWNNTNADYCQFYE